MARRGDCTNPDWAGVVVTLIGMGIIVWGGWQT
jgi:hypothetical protein